MKTSKQTIGTIALALAIGTACSGSAWAQSDQDHNAHHPGNGLAQATPAAPAPGMPAPQGGAMPGMGGQARPMQGMPGGGQGMPMQAMPGGGPGGMPGMMMGGDMEPMTRMMQMMRERMGQEDMGGPMGMMRFDHVEGRLAFLKAELGITDAQQPQWTAFADALRAQAGTMQAMRGQMMQGGAPESWPDRLARQERMLSARLDAVKAIEGPARSLYAVLSPEQQKKADELMGHARGGM